MIARSSPIVTYNCSPPSRVASSRLFRCPPTDVREYLPLPLRILGALFSWGKAHGRDPGVRGWLDSLASGNSE